MLTVLVTSANRGHPLSAKNLGELAASGSIDVLEMDVTNSASLGQAAATIDGEPIDILLNTAGIIGVPNQTAGNMDYKSWAEVLNINTMGPLRVSEQLVENVARSKRRLIVTITSGMGSLADNTSGGSIAYRSSKAAVNMVMRSLAVDFRSARRQLRSDQSGLGQNRYGRPECLSRAGRQRQSDASSNRIAWTCPLGQVL
jgi:NAD(P)-dependent dehydrogenase (short-subunit alcohol dehydrogenase family)